MSLAGTVALATTSIDHVPAGATMAWSGPQPVPTVVVPENWPKVGACRRITRDFERGMIVGGMVYAVVAHQHVAVTRVDEDGVGGRHGAIDVEHDRLERGAHALGGWHGHQPCALVDGRRLAVARRSEAIGGEHSPITIRADVGQ